MERHTLSYFVSGRDLVSAGHKGAAGASCIFGDPDYDLALHPPAAPAEKVPPAAGLAAFGFGRLPATAAEARAASLRIGKWTGTQPKLFLADRATEEELKKVVQPRALVISTHGFFLAEIEAPEGDAPEPAEPRRQVEQNPALRCGLALAGANNGARAGPGQEDGILTALEVTGLDLRGTELVVLSACETGVGEVRTGEGVAGLRQSFLIAGARVILSTLWSIPDEETARLMQLFFDNVAAGQEKAQALRNAQLAFIAERTKAGKDVDPCFWAAFTVTGR